MRQCGIIAAAGIVSLDSMINRLAEDHANCLKLATGTTASFLYYAYKPTNISGIAALKHPLFNVNVSGTHTNILIFEVNQKVDANQFCKELQEVKIIILLFLGLFILCFRSPRKNRLRLWVAMTSVSGLFLLDQGSFEWC
jgi:threonine aldolase